MSPPAHSLVDPSPAIEDDVAPQGNNNSSTGEVQDVREQLVGFLLGQEPAEWNDDESDGFVEYSELHKYGTVRQVGSSKRKPIILK